MFKVETLGSENTRMHCKCMKISVDQLGALKTRNAFLLNVLLNVFIQCFLYFQCLDEDVEIIHHRTVETALAECISNDVILICPGVYTLSSNLWIENTITIKG